MITDSQVCQISTPDLEMGAGGAASVCPEISPSVPPKVACPGCEKMLSVRVLSEKHVCTRTPRKSWKTDPDKLLERRKLAAAKRFEARMARLQLSLAAGVSSEQCSDVGSK